MPGSADRSVQIGGTVGGATVTLKGSNDGSNWEILNDPQGTPISVSNTAIVGISEITRYVKPEVSGGSSPSVTVTMLIKR